MVQSAGVAVCPPTHRPTRPGRTVGGPVIRNRAARMVVVARRLEVDDEEPTGADPRSASSRDLCRGREDLAGGPPATEHLAGPWVSRCERASSRLTSSHEGPSVGAFIPGEPAFRRGDPSPVGSRGAETRPHGVGRFSADRCGQPSRGCRRCRSTSERFRTATSSSTADESRIRRAARTPARPVSGMMRAPRRQRERTRPPSSRRVRDDEPDVEDRARLQRPRRTDIPKVQPDRGTR